MNTRNYIVGDRLGIIYKLFSFILIPPNISWRFEMYRM